MTPQEKYMPPSLRLPRFEITIKTDGQNFKHICAATDQDAAVVRVMRPYRNKNPTLLKIKPRIQLSSATLPTV